MNKYLEFKKRQLQEYKEFSDKHIFNKKQLAEGVAETDEICQLWEGAFCKRADIEKMHELDRRHRIELMEALEDDDFLYQALLYALANTDYSFTRDPEEALGILGLGMHSLKNERIAKIFKKAKRDYLQRLY